MVIAFYVLFYIFATGDTISFEVAKADISSIFNGLVNFGSDLLTHFQSGVGISDITTYISNPITAVYLVASLVVSFGVIFGLLTLCKRLMTLWVIR